MVLLTWLSFCMGLILWKKKNSQDLRGFDGPHLVDFFPVGMIWRFCLLGLIL